MYHCVIQPNYTTITVAQPDYVVTRDVLGLPPVVPAIGAVVTAVRRCHSVV